MPDGRLQPPKLLASLAKKDQRRLAIDTAKDIERACSWREVPEKPFTIQHLTRDAVERLRSEREQSSEQLLGEWSEWTIAYSSAVADNISRLRGALWAWRELVATAARNPQDREAAGLRDLVREFLRDHWALPNPPADRLACDQLARKVVESRAAVESDWKAP